MRYALLVLYLRYSIVEDEKTCSWYDINQYSDSLYVDAPLINIKDSYGHFINLLTFLNILSLEHFFPV